MAFENLQEQLKDQFFEIKSRIEESPAYQQLKERFETLTVAQQRLVVGGLAFLAAFAILAIPYSYYSSSAESVEAFENSRQLLRRLLRASRIAGETSAIPQGLSTEALRARLQGELQTMTLTEEQIGGITEVQSGLKLPARDIMQGSLAVTLKKLNLKQIVEIGHRLQNLNPGTKLTGLDVVATAEDNHYFDVIYQLTTFSVASSGGEKAEAGPGPKGRPRLPGRGAAPGNEEEEEE